MRLFFVSLLVATFACGQSLGPTVPIDKEFVLAPGESSVVEEVGVRFVRVASDSRCPADVNCIWQGDAHLQIVTTLSGRSQECDLHTSNVKSVTVDGYTINLVQLQPYPVSTKPIEPEDYRVTLKVSK